MRKFFIICCLLLIGSASGQAILEPPFGMKWGDSPERILDWARQHKLDVHITMPGKEPSMRIFRMEREGGKLPASEASALEGRYLNGRLIEVTVHHDFAGERADAVEAAFLKTKRELTTKHGEFRRNQGGRAPVVDKFSTRTTSFHREPVRGLFILIAFTEVKDLLRESSSATYSVLYRNDNLRQRLKAAPAAGGGEPGPR